MPVAFRDLREAETGLAGYLRFLTEESGRGIRGALFVVTTRGEPVSFTYSRADLPTSILWRTREARRQTIASIAAELFQACPQSPALLLTLADEVTADVFTDDVRLSVPVGRISGAMEEAPSLTWLGQSPDRESAGRRVVDALLDHHLLVEPFERATGGLDLAYGEQQ